MALIGANGMRYGAGLNRMFSGVTSVAGSHRKQNIGVAHTHLNFAAGEHAVAGVTDKASVPDGARAPVAFKMARKSGALASRYETGATFALGSLNVAAGRNVEGATSATFTIADAQLQLVVSAQGTTSISFSLPAATLSGALSAEGSTSVSFTVNTPTLGAIVNATGQTSVSVAMSGTATALGWIEGDITPFTELSPQSLAAAVWSALSSANDLAGTMGALLNASGGGSSPEIIAEAVRAELATELARLDEYVSKAKKAADLAAALSA
ncbi:MAG: hypothetical protein KA200_00135 [Burkholderiales bacterium]|nr:hypothetical protein [Burkholderiales bacterium]